MSQNLTGLSESTYAEMIILMILFLNKMHVENIYYNLTIGSVSMGTLAEGRQKKHLPRRKFLWDS